MNCFGGRRLMVGSESFLCLPKSLLSLFFRDLQLRGPWAWPIETARRTNIKIFSS